MVWFRFSGSRVSGAGDFLAETAQKSHHTETAAAVPERVLPGGSGRGEGEEGAGESIPTGQHQQEARRAENQHERER